ncbi:hypothetical protein ACGK9R_09895 [Halomonas sp. HNIBRBA4712]|uniref:hypothetical protein n=1 Tax=Halomonas sp. HNIBRBA4712 TaxID=3373087 RepID=UPI003746FFE3
MTLSNRDQRRIDHERKARDVWIPWQVLVVSGTLMIASMLAFIGYSLWLGQPLGVAARSVSLLSGLGLALLVSGIYRYRQRLNRR